MITRVVVAVLAASALIVSGGVFERQAAAASASPDDTQPILLSSDGVIWQTSLLGGIFSAETPLVPADTSTAVVWVKNPLPRRVTLQVRAVDVAPASPELARVMAVTVQAGADAKPATVALAAINDCTQLAPDTAIGANGVSRVTLTVDLSDVANRTAQRESTGFNLLLTLADAQVPRAPGPCSTAVASPVGPLASTGADEWRLMLTGALLFLVGSVLWLLARTRRRERREGTWAGTR